MIAALRLVILLVTSISFGEVLLYANTHWKHTILAFQGVPKADPPFRDLYTLTINALCERPLVNFFSAGSCSASFYGVDEGSFDYPIALFWIARQLPRAIFESPSLLAVVVAFCFLVLCLALGQVAFNRPAMSIPFLLLFCCYPFRYLLERGQLDILSWISVLAAILCSFLFSYTSTIPQRTNPNHTFREILISRILPSILVPLFVFFSVAFKGFTILEIFVLPFVFFSYHLRLAGYISLFLAPLGAFSLYNPGGVGSVATSTQVMPGEIFGINVSSSLIAPPVFLIFKVIIIVASFWVMRSLSGPVIRPRSLHQLPALILLTTSSSSFIACYLFTASANYKLVSIPFFLISFAWRLGNSKLRSQTPLFRDSSLLFVVVLVFPLMFAGYRPYIENLQFLVQEFQDLFLLPALLGVMIYSMAEPFFPRSLPLADG